MEEFVLGIDRAKFSSTNEKWNQLMLNDPWSVGYVSTLIELQPWPSKEDWESFYYESGRQRKIRLGANAALLEDYSLVRTNKSRVDALPYNIKNLNTQYGRTQEDLALKAQTLYNAVKNNGYGLTLEECVECVRFRVICETWNGIILRENNTVQTLQAYFPQLAFTKTSGEDDHRYAVDFEIALSGILICGIQVKPKSYTWTAPYIIKARSANRVKNAEYSRIKGVPVYDVISKANGEILNPSVLEDIKKLAAK